MGMGMGMGMRPSFMAQEASYPSKIDGINLSSSPSSSDRRLY